MYLRQEANGAFSRRKCQTGGRNKQGKPAPHPHPNMSDSAPAGHQWDAEGRKPRVNDNDSTQGFIKKNREEWFMDGQMKIALDKRDLDLGAIPY